MSTTDGSVNQPAATRRIRAFRSAVSWLSGTGGGMRDRSLRAGAWMTFLLGMRHPVLLARTLVLARILTPQDFGLMAIVLAVTGLIETIGSMGLRSALIQRSEINREQLNTAWTVDAVRGFISAGALLAVAPFIARFFDSPQAADLLRFAALAPLLVGLTNIGTVLFDRDLDYRRKFVILVSRTIVDVTVSITLALVLRDVWALVYGLIAGAATSTLLSYAIVSYRPRPQFNSAELRSMFGFSSWMVASRYLRAINSNMDFILIGRLVDVGTLGIYQMAWRVSYALTNAFNSMAVPQISFAGYSRIHDDLARLVRGYRQTSELLLSLVFPLVTGLVVIAPLLTEVILGSRWVGAVAPMQILAVAAAAQAMRSQSTSVLLASGDSKRVFLFDSLTTVALISGLLSMVPLWEARGAAWAVLASLLFVLPMSYWELKRRLSIDLKTLIQPLAVPVVLSMAVAVIGLGLRELVQDSGVPAFLVVGLGMAAGYFAGIAGLHRFIGQGPLSLYVAVLKNRSGGRNPGSAPSVTPESDDDEV